MTRPAVSATTERLYEALPEVYRVADEQLRDGSRGYPLLRYLASVGDQLSAIEVLIDRWMEDEDHPSELLDPLLADRAWLPWLAQLVGVRLSPALRDEAARDAVASAGAGWRSGTLDGIVAAARSALVGTRRLTIASHATPAGPGGPWDLTLRVAQSEAIRGLDAVARAVITSGAKPAGVRLWVHGYATPWNLLHAELPTWAHWGRLTWRQIEEWGLVRVEPTKPLPPSGFGAIEESPGSVRLSWTRPGDAAQVQLRRVQGTVSGPPPPPRTTSEGTLVAALPRGTDSFVDSVRGGYVYAYSAFSLTSSAIASDPASLLITTTAAPTGGGLYGEGLYGDGLYGGS